MPLRTGSSDAVIQKNIAELIKAGHKPDQAAAIAYSKAGKTKEHMANGGKVPMDLDLKKGALHKELGVPEGEKIPAGKIGKAMNSKNELERKRAQFAENASKWQHKAEGGEIKHYDEGTPNEPVQAGPDDGSLQSNSPIPLNLDQEGPEGDQSTPQTVPAPGGIINKLEQLVDALRNGTTTPTTDGQLPFGLGTANASPSNLQGAQINAPGGASGSWTPNPPTPDTSNSDMDAFKALTGGDEGPGPNDTTGNGNTLQSIINNAKNQPPTDYDFLNKYGTDARNAVLQKLIQSQTSGGNLIAQGVGGLGDAIVNSFGKGGAGYQKGIQQIAQNATNQGIGAFDTARANSVEDFKNNVMVQENDPNSPIMQSFKKMVAATMPSLAGQMDGMTFAQASKVLPEFANFTLAQAQQNWMRSNQDQNQLDRFNTSINNDQTIKPSMITLANVNRAQALLDQVKSQPGGADSRQYTELAMSTAKTLAGNGSISQDEVERLIPSTFKGDLSHYIEYLSNNPQGTEAQAFTNRLQDTLTREKTVAKSNIQDKLPAIVNQYQDVLNRHPEVLKGFNQQYGIDATKPTTSYIGGNNNQSTSSTPQYQQGKTYKFSDGSVHTFNGGDPTNKASWSQQ